MSEQARASYLSCLQVFRGLAALGVVVYHAGLFTERQSGQVLLGGWYHFGELGVDFFFVLSGFIIAFVHGDELGQPARAPRYLARRFFRVYPLLFLLTTAKLALELVAWQRGGAGPDLSRILSSYLLLPGPDGGLPVITAAWTLQHEVLFYALFLLALLLGRRAGLWIMGGWMTLIVILSGTGVNLEGMPRLIFSAHNVEFVFGILACHLFKSQRVGASRSLGAALALVGLVGGAWLYDSADGADQPLLVRLFLGAGFAALIYLMANWEKSRARSTWPRWACWLGDASYSIYLGHSLILLAVIGAGAKASASGKPYAYIIAVVAIALSLTAGGLIWRFIEMPCLKKFKNALCYS
jgi:exopolysaccharide production protein ExoZ